MKKESFKEWAAERKFPLMIGIVLIVFGFGTWLVGGFTLINQVIKPEAGLFYCFAGLLSLAYAIVKV